MEPIFSPDEQHVMKSFLDRILHLVEKQDEPLVYTVEEAASKLQISRSKVYELARRKYFPAIKIDGRVMIPRQRLEEWINEKAD